MTVESRLSNDGGVLTIKVSDTFNFALQQDFRNSYKDVIDASQIKLDLSMTSYMDSSSLGMLLLLKEHADKYKIRIEITNPSEPIRRILETANFDKIFPIS
ncbi:MAG: STAS domain-containing protein [Thioalkalispiraceae bacterium]|jgi:anti-anti-sigma factor